MRRLGVMAMLLLAAAARAQAQELAGTVRDSASALPLPGVVVLLLSSDGRTLGRTITNEHGEYRAALAEALTHARFLRLGFRPRDLPIPPSVNGVATLDMSMETIPAMLEAVHVSANPNCSGRSHEAQALALLEQARAALLASIVSRETNRPSVVRYAFDRTHDGTADSIIHMAVRVDSVANTTASFAATHSARDFVRRGFREDGPDGEVYSAPDAEVLLDSAFSNAYCFRLLTDTARARQVGLGFTAARPRNDRVDVDGALWVDTSARALSEITFVYKGVDRSIDKLRPGGTISFHQMPNGSVLIDRWTLRLIGAFVDTGMAARPGGSTEHEDRGGYYIHEFGGELAHAHWPDGTAWDASLATLRATARTRKGLPAAHQRVWLADTPYRAVTDDSGHVEINDLVPGPYTAVVVDSSLLTIGITIPTSLEFVADRGTTFAKSFTVKSPLEYVVERCRPEERARYSSGDASLVIARFLDVQRHPVANVRWTATVTSDPADDTQHAQAAWTALGDNVETDFDGTVEICSSMPRRGWIRIGGSYDRQNYLVAHKLAPGLNVVPIVLASATRVANLDMLKAPAPVATATATLAGFVLTDSTQQPIGGAEVSLPELGKSILSDEKGRFLITNIPPGEQHVQVRRIGYGAADTKLQFDAGQTVVRRFVLPHAAALQAVDVNAEGVHIPSFDEHKRTGLGRFMERAEIAKFDGLKTSSVLQNIAGLDVAGSRSAAYVMSRNARPPSAACGLMRDPKSCLRADGFYVAEPYELTNYGVPAVGCYSLVYVNGVLMNGSKDPTEPFDVNQTPPDLIEAIEYYATPSETPLEYSKTGSKCGVLVIWTSIKKR